LERSWLRVLVVMSCDSARKTKVPLRWAQGQGRTQYVALTLGKKEADHM